MLILCPSVTGLFSVNFTPQKSFAPKLFPLMLQSKVASIQYQLLYSSVLDGTGVLGQNTAKVSLRYRLAWPKRQFTTIHVHYTSFWVMCVLFKLESQKMNTERCVDKYFSWTENKTKIQHLIPPPKNHTFGWNFISLSETYWLSGLIIHRNTS